MWVHICPLPEEVPAVIQSIICSPPPPFLALSSQRLTATLVVEWHKVECQNHFSHLGPEAETTVKSVPHTVGLTKRCISAAGPSNIMSASMFARFQFDKGKSMTLL
jgi:hypothetical protein